MINFYYKVNVEVNNINFASLDSLFFSVLLCNGWRLTSTSTSILNDVDAGNKRMCTLVSRKEIAIFFYQRAFRRCFSSNSPDVKGNENGGYKMLREKIALFFLFLSK